MQQIRHRKTPDLTLYNGKVFRSTAAHPYVQAVAVATQSLPGTLPVSFLRCDRVACFGPMIWGGQRVTFRTWDRVLSLLAIGFASSIYLLHAPLANAAPPLSGSSAQQSVTVEDVQRILAPDTDKADKGKSDAEVARQLSGLELTERMSSSTLRSLEHSAPGTKSRRALVALADASVFLSPAAADVVSQAAPDGDEQRHMLTLTVGYLARTLPRLPNFYATRTVVRFEDKPVGKRTKTVSQNHSSWRQVGSSKVIVAYRDGKEVVDPREWGKHPHHPEGEGLVTRGTFGPILLVVFVDVTHSGGFTWSRWERGHAGTRAVFRYSVPQDQSHYSVGFHALSSGEGNAEQTSAYHGEVAIDPVTGTILRVTVQAEQPLGSPIQRSDIMVEYGPVEIGGKTYTCPVRSVSISMGETGLRLRTDPFGEFAPPPSPLLNDVVFDNYHQFRSESRILPGVIPNP